MTTYINDAVVGNSKLLACIDKKGELVRMFWPHIDYPQHIERLQMGIYSPDHTLSTKWLHDDAWIHTQQYIDDANILRTMLESDEFGFKIMCTDFAVMNQDALVREIEVQNTGREVKNINFLLFAGFMNNLTDWRSSLFDFDADCIICYRHDIYIAVSGSSRVTDFQIGNNPYDAAVRGQFYGIDDIGMTGESVQAWKLGEFQPDEIKSMDIYICCASTLKECIKKVRELKSIGANQLMEETKRYWISFLQHGKKMKTGSLDLDMLYKRSLLVFKLMSEEESGGLLAAPEIDEDFSRCGRYAYCWGRDAAFITSAMDRAGYTEIVDEFYYWAINTQADNGAWYQRYHMDGNLAPSWGIQIDETGTLIWGMRQHYDVIQNKDFLESVWPSVEKGAEFLCEFIDRDNGLPKATYDLWEERIGQHTYSAAAVCAGLKAAVEISKILNKQDEYEYKWQSTADTIRNAMADRLWDPVQNKFFRGVNVKVEGWGFEGHGGKKEVEANPKGYKRWVSALDIMTDVSLIGVALPFEVFDYEDDRVIKTVQAIEERLTSQQVGGIRRYETDGYMGGNPWILTTLWVALYHAKRKNYDKAKEYLLWAAQHRTELGLLPEQVDKDSGKPVWVIPLTWSHAMYVLVYLELAGSGQI